MGNNKEVTQLLGDFFARKQISSPIFIIRTSYVISLKNAPPSLDECVQCRLNEPADNEWISQEFFRILNQNQQFFDKQDDECLRNFEVEVIHVIRQLKAYDVCVYLENLLYFNEQFE